MQSECSVVSVEAAEGRERRAEGFGSTPLSLVAEGAGRRAEGFGSDLTVFSDAFLFVNFFAIRRVTN